MVELISFGPFTFYFFGLMIGIGIVLGTLLLKKLAEREQVDFKRLFDIGLYAFIGGIIGARIFYIVFYNPTYYFANPVEIFMIHRGGLSIHGGLFAGLLTSFYLLKRYRLPIWKVLDIAAPALILAQAVSRIGCDVFGRPLSNNWHWGVMFNGEYLHPVQAYEFILSYLLLGYLLWLFYRKVYQGQVFLHYLIGFMLIRSFVEFFRINPSVGGFVSISHLLGLAFIILTLGLISYCRKNSRLPKSDKQIPAKNYYYTVIIIGTLIIVSLFIYYGVHTLM
ncbi:prolipoprotein diacylglyceryl transferase [Amphibacillus cookii]|uniref:prolipoprotein diacylglyceryl transferase n=1 Tax=Amphibacillus cookii TaxID=767787 RepID=UPI001957E58D|nr:prolipoprotein diacylglyceryl transferase [Amphibacillus cookii]MBM7541436.1 phosphatidylglycerol:prolipoprotein diacylglycerol transferase [Amphibacillus cookii]